MANVYFDKENYGNWVVYELEDYYNFKSVNYQTNEESNHILSWSRNYDESDLSDNVDRIYDVEIDEVKYYFIFCKCNKGWDVISEDPNKLELLVKEKSLFFTGEAKIVE